MRRMVLPWPKFRGRCIEEEEEEEEVMICHFYTCIVCHLHLLMNDEVCESVVYMLL